MKLLLDTHAVLWFAEGSEELSGAARVAVEDAGNECWVSHASVWEIAVKIRLGKLTLQVPFDSLFPGVVAANGWRVLASEIRHFRELLTLPLHHRDPFDRLIIAQARAEGLTIVSRDRSFRSYDVPILW